MSLPYIARLQILGLKGGAVDIELERQTTLGGPNGAGKTRVAEAIAFLLGRPVAGMEIAGGAMRDLLHGQEIRVVATIRGPKGDMVVSRIRQLVGGTFKRPTLLIAGQPATEDQLATVLGGVGDLPGGRDLIIMSEAKLVAAIAGFSATGEAVDALQDRVATAGVSVLGCCGSATERLDWLADASRGALKAARAARLAIEQGTDLSRQEVGDRFDAAEAARLRKGKDVAQADLEDAQRAAGAARAKLEAHDEVVSGLRAEMAEIDRKISSATSSAGPGEEDLGLASTNLTLLEAKVLDRVSAERAALANADKAEKQRRQARLELEDAQRRKANAEKELAEVLHRASQIAAAPCSACDLWQPEDPWADEVNLVGTCGLLASSRRAKDSAAPLEKAIEGMLASIQACEQKVVAANATADAAQAAVKETGAALALVTAQRKSAATHLNTLQAAQDRAASAPLVAEWHQRRNQVDLDISGRDTLRDELVADIGACKQAVDAARADLAAAAEELRQADQRAERFRRLQADRERLKDAAETEEALKGLLADVETVQRGFLEDGIGMLRASAGRYLPGLTLDVSGGRLGVRDASGTFWAGAGLSAAQRAMLELALDRGFEVIAGRHFPIMIVEADPIDDQNLNHIREAVEKDVAKGAVAQAIMISWRPLPFQGWTSVKFGPPPPAAEGDDPWADEEEDIQPIPEMLAKMSGPSLALLWDDPDLPELAAFEMPRRLEARREAAAVAFASLGYKTAREAIRRAGG